jgi:hypothetical protein
LVRLAVLTLILLFSSGSIAISFPTVPVPIDFPAPATCLELGVYRAIGVPVENTLISSITVVVFAVFHNSLGQTLEVSTSTVTIGSGKNVTAYGVNTLPYGNYSIDVFVWTVNGSSVSSEQQLQMAC